MGKMEMAALFLVALAVLLFAYVLYDKNVRDSIIHQEFADDFEETRKAMKQCDSKEAGEVIIDSFAKRWEPYVDGWTLSDATHRLYMIIFYQFDDAALN